MSVVHGVGQVWEVATSGTVESIDVCEEENLVIAVVTHAYVDAAGETQSIQGGATAAGAGGNGSDSDDDVVMVTTLSGLGVDSPRAGAQTQRQPERTGIDHVAAFSIKVQCCAGELQPVIESEFATTKACGVILRLHRRARLCGPLGRQTKTPLVRRSDPTAADTVTLMQQPLTWTLSMSTSLPRVCVALPVGLLSAPPSALSSTS